MMTKYLLAVFLILSNFSNAYATSTDICENIYRPQAIVTEINLLKFFPELESEYPLIARLVTGKVANRIQSLLNDDDWNDLAKIIDACHGKSCAFELKNDKFNFEGDIRVSKKSLLTFVVKYFQIKVIDESGRRQKVEIEKRPKNLNLKFLTLVNLIFSSVNRYLETHEEIDTVRIKGSRVVNLSLAKSLKKIGFKEKTPSLTTIAKSIVHSGNMFTAGSLMALSNVVPSKTFHFLMNSMAIGPLGVSALVEKKSKQGMAKDWILELPVSREQNNDPLLEDDIEIESSDFNEP